MNPRCPICHTEVAARRPDNPSFPFCSGRCKTIDLGRWLGGEYVLAARDEAPSEYELALAENEGRHDA